MVFDDFFDWLESDAGEAASQAVDDIQMALAGATVDINNRKIIWANGEKLSIDQSAEKINSNSKVGHPSKVLYTFFDHSPFLEAFPKRL